MPFFEEYGAFKAFLLSLPVAMLTEVVCFKTYFTSAMGALVAYLP